MWVRPGAYPRVEHLKGASFGYAPALSANIRLSWEGLPETNNLAYYENLYITAVKSFIVLAPDKNFVKVANFIRLTNVPVSLLQSF
jgi:hypothetical protein